MGNNQYQQPYNHYGSDAQNPDSMPTDPNSLSGTDLDDTDAAYGGNGGFAGYNADGTPFQRPPAYQPNQPNRRSSARHAPRWPTPRKPKPSTPIAPVPVLSPPRVPRRLRAAATPAPTPPMPKRREPAYIAPPVRQPAPRAAAPVVYRSQGGFSLPRLPYVHIILVFGVLAMGFALSQPWGVAGDGSAIFIKDFTNTRLQQSAGVDTGALAVQTASFLFSVVFIFAAALLLFNLLMTLFNKVIGAVGLSGCATTLFFPVLWGAAFILLLALVAAAGFAGISVLNRLPLVRDNGFAIMAVAHHTIGFYAWCVGIVAVFIGMLGELAMRRR